MSKRNSGRDRAVVLDAHLRHDAIGPYMTCHCCGMRFNPATVRWRADHIRRFAEGGESSAQNLWPILEKCDAGPGGKAARDASEVAKGKRVRARHFGVDRPRGWWKPAKRQPHGEPS